MALFQMFQINVFADDENGTGSKVDLTQMCAICNGNGKITNYDAETFEPCHDCNNTGSRLTYDGQGLLRFIRAFASHPDIDLDDLPF